MKEIITTERLLLREAVPGDAAMLAAYARRNRSFLEIWEPTRHEAYYTEGAQREIIEIDRADIRAGRLFKLWISLREQPEAVIGSVSLGNIVRGSFQSCNLGYRLDAGLLGKGYMPEAVLAVIRHAFDVMRLHRIEANIIPRNTASLAVVSKLGFQEEGLARRYLKINGIWEDHLHMVILNDELELEESP